jgi:hypothetical protein
MERRVDPAAYGYMPCIPPLVARQKFLVIWRCAGQSDRCTQSTFATPDVCMRGHDVD